MSYAQAKLRPTPKFIQRDYAEQSLKYFRPDKTDSLLKNGCYSGPGARRRLGRPKGHVRLRAKLQRQVQGRFSLTIPQKRFNPASYAVELKYFKSKEMRKKVSCNVTRMTTGKSRISVRWVDTNKGDELNPNYRW